MTIYCVEVLAVPLKQKFRGLEDAAMFAAHDKEAVLSTGISKLVKAGQSCRYVGLASRSVSTVAKVEVVGDSTVLVSHGDPSASLDGNSGAPGMLMAEGDGKDELGAPVCTAQKTQ